MLGNGRAVRYGIGVGREGFTWAGVQSVARKQEWPDWHPPPEMIERQPYLPRFMAGGPGNPLGARAMYLGNSLYRIHGTNAPSTIGQRVSSGCIRLTNEDVADLYNRVTLGAKVVVLPDSGRRAPGQRRERTCAAPVAQPAPRIERRYEPRYEEPRRLCAAPAGYRSDVQRAARIAAPILTPALRDRASTNASHRIEQQARPSRRACCISCPLGM